MFCTNCGRTLNDGEKFCPYCGTAVAKPDSVPEPGPVVDSIPNPEPTPFVNSQAPNYHNATFGPNYRIATLVLGILSVCFSALNYFGIYYVHLVGLVLGIITVSMVAKAKRTPGGTFSPAGNVLGIIGLCLGGIALVVGFISSI